MKLLLNEDGTFSVDVTEKAIRVYLRDVEICALNPHTSVAQMNTVGKPTEWTENEDIDENGFMFAEQTLADGKLYTWSGKSNLWSKKVYSVQTDKTGFSYRVAVEGKGSVGSIKYFNGAGCANELPGSDYEFCEYFVPMTDTYKKDRLYHNAFAKYKSFMELMVPYMQCFAFRTQELDKWLGLGLLAKDGEYNFEQFDYNTECKGLQSRFYLSTDMDGHTQVDGTWEAPFIRCMSADDEFGITREYSAYCYDSGLCRKRNFNDIPRWWYGPFICGWGEQGVGKNGGSRGANEKVYSKFIADVQSKGLDPKVVIIDDKWQDAYGTAHEDKNKWPDMRAFTDRVHADGKKVLLWFRLWGKEGLPDSMAMPGSPCPDWNHNEDELYADPSNPAYQQYLKETIHYLLSPEKGCLNCDGFKLDFAFWKPYGRKAVSYGGQHGIELLKMNIQQIFTYAKETKPDALINASPCHPYFAECFDQIRLHDYLSYMRCEKELMDYRKRIFATACPEQLVDTDAVGFSSRRDAMIYIRFAPSIGVPDMYQVTDTGLTDEDWAETARIWADYSAKIDEMYANGQVK